MQTAMKVFCVALPGDVIVVLTLKLGTQPNKGASVQQRASGTQGEALPQVCVCGPKSAEGLWPNELAKLYGRFVPAGLL